MRSSAIGWVFFVAVAIVMVVISVVTAKNAEQEDEAHEVRHQRCVQIGQDQEVPISEWVAFMEACDAYLQDTGSY